MFVLHCHSSTEQKDTIKDSLLIDIDRSKLGQPPTAPPFSQITPGFFWKSIYHRHWKVHQACKPLAVVRAGLYKNSHESYTTAMCLEAVQEPSVLKYLGEAWSAQGRARKKRGGHLLLAYTSINFRKGRDHLRYRNRVVRITGKTLPRPTARFESG